MRPLSCPTCRAAADRSGELVVFYRRTAARLHEALGHSAATFWICGEPVCLQNAAVLDGRRQSRCELDRT